MFTGFETTVDIQNHGKVKIWVERDGTVHVLGAREIRAHFPIVIDGQETRFVARGEETITVRSAVRDVGPNELTVELMSNKLIPPSQMPKLITHLPVGMREDPALVVQAVWYQGQQQSTELLRVPLQQRAVA